MLKLTPLALVVACAVAPTLATSLPAAADDCGCKHNKCTSETCHEDSTCSFEALSNLIHAIFNPPTYAETPAKYVRPNPPEPYRIQPPDVLLVNFTADVDGQCSKSCKSEAKQGADCCTRSKCKSNQAKGECTSCNGQEKAACKVKAQELLVTPDGKITLGRYGTVYVAGMTAEEASRAIERHLAAEHSLSEAKAQVSVAKSNSRVAYLILQRGRQGDEVIRVELPDSLAADTNVGELLEYVYEQEDFDTAAITLRRPAPHGVGNETILPVSWEGAGPTVETNHAILPGDRIFIRTSHEVPSPPQKLHRVGHRLFAPEPPTPADEPDATISADKITIYGDRRIKVEGVRVGPTPAVTTSSAPTGTMLNGQKEIFCYDVMIVADPQGNFAEFKALQKESGVLVADADAMLATVRILEKNNLVGIVSRPRLMVELGRQGALSIRHLAVESGKDIGHWLDLTLSAERVDDKLAVTLDLVKKHAGQQYKVEVDKMIVEKGQVLIVRTRGTKLNADAPELSPTYLFVTPSIPDPTALKRREILYYGAPPSERPDRT